jgi:hypothetical protein
VVLVRLTEDVRGLSRHVYLKGSYLWAQRESDGVMTVCGVGDYVPLDPCEYQVVEWPSPEEEFDTSGEGVR